MSTPAQTVRNRREAAAYYARHRDDPEWRAHRAAQARRYRRYKRIENDLLHDELAVQPDRDRRLRRESLLSASIESAVIADDADGDDRDEEVEEEDDFDEMPTSTLDVEDSLDDEAWSCSRLQSIYQRARQKDSYMKSDTGLPLTVFDNAWTLVEPFFNTTCYNGQPRQRRSRRKERVPSIYQFYLTLLWARAVSFLNLSKRLSKLLHLISAK